MLLFKLYGMMLAKLAKCRLGGDFMKKFLLAFLFALTALPVFAKDIPLEVTETEWGFEISNLDAKGKRICKGFLNFQEQENVFIIFKTNRDSFYAEELAKEIVYNKLPYIAVLSIKYFSAAARDKKTQMYGPLSNYDSILVISSAGKIEECSAYSDGKFMQLKVSSVGSDTETQFAKLVNACAAEKERIEAEKKAEEERLAREKEIEEKRLARETRIKELMAGGPNFSKNDTYIYSLISGGDNNGTIAIEAFIGGSYGDSFDKIILPAKLEGMPVKEVRGMNFSGSTLKTVVIPASVNYIGDEAFKDCGIENLIFEKGAVLKSIGNEAFAFNKLKAVNIPSNVKWILKAAFKGNEIETLSYDARLKKQDTSDSGSTHIYYESLTIGEEAFANNKLKNCNIAHFVDRIGQAAFKDNKMETLTFENRPKLPGDTWLKDERDYWGFPTGRKIREKNPDYYKSLALAKEAFANNKLKACNIPFYVHEIGNKAFADNQIEDLRISGLMPDGTYEDSCVVLDFRAFYQNKIKKIRIRPFLVDRSVVYNYSGTQGKASLYVEGGFVSGLDSLEEIFFEYGVTIIPRYSFADCTSLKKISLPSGGITIGLGAFYNCQSLSEVILRKTSSIKNSSGCFYNCPMPLQTKSQLLNLGMSGEAFFENESYSKYRGRPYRFNTVEKYKYREDFEADPLFLNGGSEFMAQPYGYSDEYYHE